MENCPNSLFNVLNAFYMVLVSIESDSSQRLSRFGEQCRVETVMGKNGKMNSRTRTSVRIE